MTQLFVAAATLAFGMIVSTASGYAQQGVDIGKHEYATSCAFCHGESGKGDGLFIKYYNKRAADLTVLQKNNFGVFPFDRVYQVIDGRQALAAHGPADMPVWGDTYTMEAQSYVLGLSSKDLESFVRGRIIALVGYIYTLQAK